jgi:trans-aconitate 2-methyltransferase
VPHVDAKTVLDLGCGAGNLMPHLLARWPNARVEGLDNSSEMLERARLQPGAESCHWIEADVSLYEPPAPLCVLFTNATLQWVPNHEALLPRLLGWLRPGGVFAMQIPRMGQAPSHALQAEVAAEGPWRERLADVAPLLGPDPAFYYDLLAGATTHLDIWETENQQVLEGTDPVLEWVKGTSLRRYLTRLKAKERDAFVSAYRERIAPHYPRRPSGQTLYPFRRLFLVARV